MDKDTDCTRTVKPRTARGQVRRAARVEVPVYLEGGQVVLVRVSKAEALRALGRARNLVAVAVPFGDGNLILG